MRKHRQTPPKRTHPMGPLLMPHGAEIYKMNGKFYYRCGKCGIVGGGNLKFIPVVLSCEAHGNACSPP